MTTKTASITSPEAIASNTTEETTVVTNTADTNTADINCCWDGSPYVPEPKPAATAATMLDNAIALYEHSNRIERKAIEEKVNSFLESHTFFETTIRESEMVRLFGNLFGAVSIFKERGFEVTPRYGTETGHLWWKKRTEDAWVIKIPQELIERRTKKS